MLDKTGTVGRGLDRRCDSPQSSQSVKNSVQTLLVDSLDTLGLSCLAHSTLDWSQVGHDRSRWLGQHLARLAGGKSLLGNDMRRERGGLSLEQLGHVGDW